MVKQNTVTVRSELCPGLIALRPPTLPGHERCRWREGEPSGTRESVGTSGLESRAGRLLNQSRRIGSDGETEYRHRARGCALYGHGPSAWAKTVRPDF